MKVSTEGLSGQELVHLKSALDESAIVAITDAKGVITYINQKFCEISKYSTKELIGKTHRVVNSGLHSKDFFSQMWKTISSGQVWEGEIRNRAKDGSFYWVNTTIVPFLNEQGKPLQYVAVRYDITKRVLFEEQLQINAKKLETYNRELQVSREQIMQQDRMASAGLLASSLAHEIGTPLGIIRSRAEIVERKAKENEELRKDMSTVIGQIDRITKLVNSLLNLAREKKSTVASAVNLNEVVQDVLNLLQHELQRKGIVLDLQFQDGLQVMAESGPLGQVLLNLLVNSVHAIEEAKQNGVESDHRITMSVEKKNDIVELSIQDSGCGIAEENMSQLFKPFFTTKDIGHGTGLGLATSYKLIQSWDGKIFAQSQPGQGATFKIQLHLA
jgi:PAS domain S-box-containing protein